MSAVRRFLFRSTFLRPSVLLPMVGGVLAGLASWATGGSLPLTALAVTGIGGGAIWMVVRTMLNANDLTQQALNVERQATLDAENQELDRLARQLRTDRDHRTQDLLRILRDLRDDFDRVSQRPGAELLSARIGEQIGQIFQTAVGQLRETFRLTEKAEGVVGAPREQLLSQRNALILEVQSTTNRISDVIHQYREMRPDNQEQELKALKDELDANLEIAKRTEQRMKEIENPLSTHETFLKE